MEKPRLNVVSMSGGKDSTVTALLALESGEPCKFIFADTGHEHSLTYEYLDYLESRLGVTVERLKADFSKQIARKAEVVRGKWVADGAVSPERAEEICALLVPTGNPFLDLCIWKGRFPSTRARFCSEELKHHPLDTRMLELAKEYSIVSWQGVRADESPSRAKLPDREMGDFYEIYRPILKWSAEQVFQKHDEAGVDPNPLYKMGMSRVGCMPCIHSRKSEISAIAKRFPNEVARVAEWERIVSSTAKRGSSTFFQASTDPTIATKNNDEISTDTHGINRIVDWSQTARGGRQRDLIASSEDVTMCSSAYGLCE
jgi:3'-phosphoadenosine 5'-phosphosulfate sulfotransferase (PAPS reductase)/FAD synthetase